MDLRRRLAPALVLALALTACGSEPHRLAGAAPSPTAAPCPTEGTSAAISWVDFVVVDGRQYHRQPSWGRAPGLGRVVGTTRCRMADSGGRGPSGPVDGDAGYLPVGTALREVVGHDPRFRLAAETPTGLVRYEVEAVEGARTGADLLPGVAPHVRDVVLLEVERGEGVIGRVPRAAVREVVEDIVSAPAVAFDKGDRDLFVGLVLDDGTTVRRAYVSEAGLLFPGLQLPERAQAHLRAARD